LEKLNVFWLLPVHGPVWSTDPAGRAQGVFGVADEEPEAGLAVAPARPPPVVRLVVAEEIRQHRVAVAAEENDQHFIDEVVDVEPDRHGRIANAIGVAAFELEVFRVAGVGGADGADLLPERAPGEQVAVGHLGLEPADVVAAFDHVVVVARPPR
jgi:hypothetical protein